MNKVRRNLICLAGALLTGCTCLPIPQQESDLRRKTGKLLARDTLSPLKRFAAGFRLDSTEKGLKLDFLGPLNTTLARLEVTEDQATFLQPGKQAVVDENAEALMERMLGFSVPLSAVSDWTEGEPNRRYPFRRLDDNSFEQLGWTVRVLEREQSGAARKLAFTKGTLALVVVIDTKAGQ